VVILIGSSSSIYECFHTFPKVKSLNVQLSEDARKILREMGLTEYETRAYLALIEQGVMTASEISKKANVPYSKIYEVLNSLEDKGWIETQHERPTKYYPKAPTEALERIILQTEEKLEKWKNVILESLQPLYEKREIRERPEIWILHGEHNVLAKISEMLNSVRKELMIAVPSFAKSSIKNIASNLFSDIIRKDVNVMIMVTPDFDSSLMSKILSIGEIRIRNSMFGGGIIVDGSEALLLLGEKGKVSLVIWSSHGGLVRFAREYFQFLWNSSEKIDRA